MKKRRNKEVKDYEKMRLANLLCETNVFTDEEKKEIRERAEKHCTGDPYHDHYVLGVYCKRVSDACD